MSEPATKSLRVLVADDEESMRFFVDRGLRRRGYEVEAFENGTALLERARSAPFDAAVVDLKMPGPSGIDVLRELRELDPDATVLLMTAYGTIETAIEATRLGAFHYLTKPFEFAELVALLERALEHRAAVRENRNLRSLASGRDSFGPMVGQSDAMRAVFATLETLGSATSTVLITGESGTGKELVAKALHVTSGRSGEFIAVNCAGIPETLFESELFGHEPGAFTGAVKGRGGLVARAEAGTLFLDEIGEISLANQKSLERFLQEREYAPLGSESLVKANVRIVAATNRDLAVEVAEGRFRQELLFRLDVVPIHVPPLRERPEDVAPLVAHFVRSLAKRHESLVRSVSIEAMLALTRYEWPGNVRELQNVVERLVVLHRDEREIDVDALPAEIFDPDTTSPEPSDIPIEGSFSQALATFEREWFEHLLESTGGSVAEAARRAGLSRGHLHRKLRQLDVDPAKYRG
ncbi:MAG: sigma-54-dependent Fis family transcriptional regulator [Planctomycetes bacterium]|nr:sigma-54-dependent Fis family transcriptional regulator [Planctomycetota bacterium]